MKPLVSIIIPTYNDAGYVCSAIDSALSQTYKNIEILVVDDGSTDNTKNILKKYNKKIKYFYQKNKGLSGARNAGMRMAKGDYISLLDADDIYHKDRIKNQIKYIRDYDFCYSDVRHFKDKTNKLLKLKYKYHSGNIFKKLLKKNFIAPSAVLFKKEIINKIGYFDENLKRSEDWDYWLRIADAGYRFKYIRNSLTYMRLRSGGNLNDRVFKFDHKLDLIRSLKKFDNIDKYLFKHTFIMLFTIGYPKILKYIINKILFLKDKWRYQK